MKKFILPLLLVAALTSCKKSYTCTCTTKTTDTSSSASLEVEAQHAVSESNEAKAQSACDAKGVEQQTNFGDNTTSTTCTDVVKS